MYKVVFDTNVYVSAAGFGGKPEMLLRLCRGRHRQIELFTSHEILKETVRVLASDKFQFTKEEIADAVSVIVESAKVIEPKPKLTVIADEADNRILECAVKAKAEFIISGDRHLLDLGEYKRISVLRPAQFLNLLEKER